MPLDTLFFSKLQRLINHMIMSCLKALCSFVNTKQDHSGLCICGTHTGVSSIASSRPSSCVYLKIIILLSGIIFCLYLKVVNGIHSCRIQLNWIRDTKWYKWKPTITNTSHQFLIRRHYLTDFPTWQMNKQSGFGCSWLLRGGRPCRGVFWWDE